MFKSLMVTDELPLSSWQCAKVYNDSRYFAYPRLRISADTPLAKQTITVNCAACEQSELRVNAESHLEGVL